VDDNIVDFTAKVKDTVMTPVKSHSRGCNHTKITLDEHRRQIECQDCKKVFEAFDYLWLWANGQQRIIWRINSAKFEAEQLQDQIIELKRQKRNLQSQVSRLNKKKQQG
jgi:hypothetical protein